MSLVVHAANVHQGGGRTLLYALLGELGKDSTVFLDSRFDLLPEMNPGVRIIKVPPTLFSRLRAEVLLAKICQKADTLLCFGNLPPLLRCRGSVFIYLQNRYLSGAVSLTGMPFKVRLRITLERLWLRLLLRDSTFIVQTRAMKEEVNARFNRDAILLPFVPVSENVPLPNIEKKYDYLYVASSEPHKNHRRLLEAWLILADWGFYPSLCLTLDSDENPRLLKWIDQLKIKYGICVFNQPATRSGIKQRYAESSALIFPSLFESFGLPLLEAREEGLPILASESDYVRDVATPQESFNPESALSIARSVMRHNNWKEELIAPIDPGNFLMKLGKKAQSISPVSTS